MDFSLRFSIFQYIGKDMHKLTKCRLLRAYIYEERFKCYQIVALRKVDRLGNVFMLNKLDKYCEGNIVPFICTLGVLI